MASDTGEAILQPDGYFGSADNESHAISPEADVRASRKISPKTKKIARIVYLGLKSPFYLIPYHDPALPVKAGDPHADLQSTTAITKIVAHPPSMEERANHYLSEQNSELRVAFPNATHEERLKMKESGSSPFLDR